MIMVCMKAKDKKGEKQLRDIRPEIKEQVFKRYLRFAKDQHAIKFFNWRQRVMYSDMLSANQLLCLKYRLSYSKKWPQALRNEEKQLNHDPLFLGALINEIIPCLIVDQNKFTNEELALRYIEPT